MGRASFSHQNNMQWNILMVAIWKHNDPHCQNTYIPLLWKIQMLLKHCVACSEKWQDRSLLGFARRFSVLRVCQAPFTTIINNKWRVIINFVIWKNIRIKKKILTFVRRGSHQSSITIATAIKRSSRLPTWMIKDINFNKILMFNHAFESILRLTGWWDHRSYKIRIF